MILILHYDYRFELQCNFATAYSYNICHNVKIILSEHFGNKIESPLVI